MIRSVRLRVLFPGRGLLPLHRRVGTSTSYATVPGAEDDDEPFGNAYGAGPSRIPYEIPSNKQPKRLQRRTQSKIPSQILDSVRAKLGGISTIEPAHVHTLLYPSETFHTLALDSLNRRETEVLIHDLIDRGYALLAAKVMLRVITLHSDGGAKGRTIFKRQLVGKVFRYATMAPGYLTAREPPISRLESRDMTDINVLLPLLSALQDVRNPRPDKIYQHMLKRLVAEGQYDTAAKVYVELVEEWATEGRIAEGAHPDSFYHGGGPPREGREEWELQSTLYKTWWKGIRTWTLPSEVLSPHDRLDLWHPRKLQLPERLRQFPMPVPTSPPSMVPYPTMQHLAIILDHLELDPEKATPEAFERSMRACAILASTILSRTLPYLSARLLRQVLGQTPMHPPVYPENVKEKPDDDSAWAYTAYTHIHLAIRSVLLSPPTVPELFQYMLDFDKAKTEGAPLPQLPTAYRYQTAPLNFSACMYLAMYGLRKLRNTDSIKSIVEFTQNVYGKIRRPHFYNALFDRLNRMGAHSLAHRVEKALFNSTVLHPDVPLSSVRSPRRELNFKDSKMGDAEWETILRNASTQPDDTSLNALVSHLVASRQYDRFLDTVYRILPYLQHSKKRSSDDMDDASQTTVPRRNLSAMVQPEDATWSGRPAPTSLTPALYGIIVHGLQKTSSVNLARRVFMLALNTESRWRKSLPKGQPLSAQQQIGIQTFTSMIKLWAAEEKKYTIMEAGDLSSAGVWDEWPPPRGLERYPRRITAQLMVWKMYESARVRWRLAAWDEANSVYDLGRATTIAPDAWFFTAFIRARAVTWGLCVDEDWSPSLTAKLDLSEAGMPTREMREIGIVASDIREAGFQIPLPLLIKLGRVAPMSMEDVAAMSTCEIKEHATVRDTARAHPAHRKDDKLDFDLEDEIARLNELTEKRHEERNVLGQGRTRRA